VSLVRNEKREVLCVWNERLKGYTLPGGKAELEEEIYRAQARELREETGLETALSVICYADSHYDPDFGPWFTVVFEVSARGELGPGEPGARPKWLSEAELLETSPFREFYREVFRK
jgi:ADP-ribose pyrophosphatase YjhB (NUDIX family)